jgi:hypothetical protein
MPSQQWIAAWQTPLNKALSEAARGIARAAAAKRPFKPMAGRGA